MLPRSGADWQRAVRRCGLQNYTPGAERAFKLMTKGEKKKKTTTTMASFFALPSLLLFSNRRRAVSAEETETESGVIAVASCRKSIRLAPSQIKQMAVGSMAQASTWSLLYSRRSATKLRGQRRFQSLLFIFMIVPSSPFPPNFIYPSSEILRPKRPKKSSGPLYCRVQTSPFVLFRDGFETGFSAHAAAPHNRNFLRARSRQVSGAPPCVARCEISGPLFIPPTFFCHLKLLCFVAHLRQ